MNDLLLSEITSEHRGLLDAISLVESHIFSQDIDFQPSILALENECKESVEGIDDNMASAECFINEIYVGQIWLDKHKNVWPSNAHRIVSGLAYRSTSPVLKAAIIQEVANRCGMEIDLVFVPENVMVRILCDDVYSIIFDPITGESLNWHQLDEKLDELKSDPGQVYLESMSRKSLLIEYLSSLKTSLISEESFDKALKCVDLLLALKPGNPFEIRDRGYLLHQLDCFKVAYDDYQYFVQQCPKDPAAQLLKIELDKVTVLDTLLH